MIRVTFRGGSLIATYFGFPVALNFSARLFDNHVSIGTLCICTLANFPFWTHRLMTKGTLIYLENEEKRTEFFSILI